MKPTSAPMAPRLKRLRPLVWAAIAFAFLAGSAAVRAAQAGAGRPSGPWGREARAGVEALQRWYVPDSGLYASPAGWWNAANAITVLADYARVTGDNTWNPVIAHTFTVAQKTRRDFLNDYFDDDSWWALAWIDAYDLTGNPAYLSMAETIFARLREDGWDTKTCGGGMWWSREKKYKNAIANELFLSIAVELANRTQGRESADYLGWALREWNWFRGSGMINGDNLINDGLNSTNPEACVNNGKNPWTYNQGVILGGLVGLSRAEHNAAFLDQARAIADAAITQLTTRHGVLNERTVHGGDAPQFKGIFVRNLMELYNALPVTDPDRRRYSEFVAVNARSLRRHDRKRGNEFGAVWQGPFDSGDATRQTSALDLIIAAIQCVRSPGRN